MSAARVRLAVKQAWWHVNGTAGRSIRYRIKLLELRYRIGVALGERGCRGNRYGEPPDTFPTPPGGFCLCARTKDRLDYIPF